MRSQRGNLQKPFWQWEWLITRGYALICGQKQQQETKDQPSKKRGQPISRNGGGGMAPEYPKQKGSSKKKINRPLTGAGMQKTTKLSLQKKEKKKNSEGGEHQRTIFHVQCAQSD